MRASRSLLSSQIAVASRVAMAPTAAAALSAPIRAPVMNSSLSNVAVVARSAQSSAEPEKAWHWWQKNDNVRVFLKYVADRYDIRKVDDWYKVKTSQIFEAGGGRLISTRGHLSTVIPQLFSSVEWQPWRFESTARTVWKDKASHKKFLDWLGAKLGYKTPEDWYQLTYAKVVESGGATVLANYSGVQDLLAHVYDDVKLLPWKFAQVPDGFWDNIENRRSYVKWLKETTGVKTDAELQQKHFNDNHGGGLLRIYNSSPADVIKSLTSNTVAQLKQEYFATVANQKAFLDGLATKLGFDPKDESKWYNVKSSDVSNHGGNALLKLHKNSLYNVLKAVYPSANFLASKFETAPKFKPENIKEAIKHVEESLGLKSPDEWHRVNTTAIANLGVKTLFDREGGVAAALRKHYPTQTWDEKFMRDK